PVQITSFSYDEKRKLFHDDRSRKYYHPPPPNADLNRGYETRIERDDNVNEHLNSLLEALMQGEEVEGHQKQADLITWRGMMTKLCTVLYEDQQGFEMNVMMLNGTLYIEEHVGEAKLADRRRSKEGSEGSKRNGYYGYSFESWTCHSWRERGQGTNAWDGDVNTNVQWCLVVKTKLGSMRLILGGEVDAVDPVSNAPIEVKTSRDIRSAKDEEFFEKKMLRFYMQSFLLGIQKVIVGFRDHRGFLVTNQEMDTLAMPRAVRGKPHAWDPMACLKAASDILSAVKAHLSAHTQQSKLPDVK
ncbi:RAI1-domain-containing protein, partial [Meira miltonrushii]